MERQLAPFADMIYALFRAVFGLLFLCHGMQKLFGMFGPGPPSSGALATVAAVIELVAGTMVMVGFRASAAAFLCSGTMAVAYFMVHQPMGLMPIQNRGELAALYSFAFLLIAAKGSGKPSVDAGLR